MLTPQEVSERAFARAMGGYNMAAVDDFLDLVTADYTTLYNDNALLKGKLKTLVEKVEEYRSTEEAMRKALMSAQRLADQLVQEAQDKKQDILRDAERDAAAQTAEIRRQVEAEQARLAAAQKATAEFVEKARQLQVKAMENLDNLDALLPEQRSREEDAVLEIEDSVQRIVQAQMAAAREELAATKPQMQAVKIEDEVDEPTTDLGVEHTTEFAVDALPSLFDGAEDDDEDMERTQVIHRDFGTLEFGKDYEIR